MAKHTSGAKRSLSEQSLISLRQIAENWACSRSTVARLLEKGGVSPFDFTGKRNGTKRYIKVEVDGFMQRCLRKNPKASTRSVTAVIDERSH